MYRLMGIFWLFAVSLVVGQTTYHVSPDGSHNPPFSNINTAATNIQVAVDLAVSGETILVHDGFYVLSQPVLVNKAIRIVSVKGPSQTIVDGNGTNRCFYLSDVACIISGLTITNGYYEADYGGGISCESTLPVVSNCVITGCSALGGGGMYSGTLVNSVVSNNNAIEWSGGLDSGVASNCLFVGNHCGYDGGAASLCTIINCTVVGNSASGEFDGGGGLDTCDSFNSIIFSNTASAGADDISNILSIENCCSPAVPSHGVDGNITNYPGFINFAGGNYRLTEGSPCIDTGNNAYVASSTDLDGNPRISNGIVDMGAYEFQAGIFSISGQWLDSGFLLQWPTAVSNTYQVLWTTNLISGFTETGPVINYPQNSYTDTVHSAESQGFYKVRVELQ